MLTFYPLNVSCSNHVRVNWSFKRKLTFQFNCLRPYPIIPFLSLYNLAHLLNSSFSFTVKRNLQPLFGDSNDFFDGQTFSLTTHRLFRQPNVFFDHAPYSSIAYHLLRRSTIFSEDPTVFSGQSNKTLTPLHKSDKKRE